MVESKRLSRREFLTIAGAAAGAALLAACAKGTTPLKEPATATPPLTEEDLASAAGVTVEEWRNLVAQAKQAKIGTIATPVAGAEVQATPTAIATATPTAVGTLENLPLFEITGDLFGTAGIPKQVDVSTVDTAKGGFKNTIGKGTEAFFAEPGKLLVGPDYPQDRIDKAGGAIERLNELNHGFFETKGPSSLDLPEGGFMIESGNQMTVRLGESVIHLQGAPAHNWLLVVRGRNSDGKPDTDFNIRAEFWNYIPGHIEVRNYPGKPAGGFISENQFKEITQTSHTEGTNCGADGCTGLSVAMYDVNTGAFTVLNQASLNAPFVQVYSNWQTRN